MSEPVFTLKGFLAYCETQGFRPYFYERSDDCAWVQYLRWLGFPNATCDSFEFSLDGTGRDDRPLPDGVDDCVIEWPNNFAALATRLRRRICDVVA